MKRTNFHVLYKNKRWELHVKGAVVACEVKKRDVLRVVTDTAWDLWYVWEVPSEVFVHNKKDGRITAKGRSTFGNDPKKSKG